MPDDIDASTSPIAEAAPKHRRRPGPYSRDTSLVRLDNRTKEGRLMKDVVADLTRHVGGAPSITQRQLIDRAAWLSLHLAMMDSRAIATGRLSDRDAREYLAWNNSYVRTLAALGLASTAAVPPTLADIMAAPRQTTTARPSGKPPEPVRAAADTNTPDDDGEALAGIEDAAQ